MPRCLVERAEEARTARVARGEHLCPRHAKKQLGMVVKVDGATKPRLEQRRQHSRIITTNATLTTFARLASLDGQLKFVGTCLARRLGIGLARHPKFVVRDVRGIILTLEE